MTINTRLFTLLVLFSGLSPSLAGAAELRGQFVYDATQVANPTVTVFCNGKDPSGSSQVAQSGNYAVRGLPAGQDCSFRVTSGGKSSRRIPFSTTRSVTIYSGKLRERSDKILVLKR